MFQFFNKPFSSERKWIIASCLLFLVIFVLICLTFRSYGITWDEMSLQIQGYWLFQWYFTFFHPQNFKLIYHHYFLNMNMYPSFYILSMSFFSYLFALFFPSNFIESFHLLTALMGLLGIVYAYRLGKRLAGSRAGFFSALFLVLTPRFYGHMFNNPKDAPFAVLYLIAIFYLIKVYDEIPNISFKTMFKVAIVIGLALGTRISGLLLYGYCFVLYGLWFAHEFFFSKKSFNFKKDCLTPGLCFVVILIISWIVMILFWPQAQVMPISTPFLDLKLFSNFNVSFLVLFNGYIYQANHIPWNYIIVWILITVPDFYFIAFIASCVAAYFGCKRLNSDKLIKYFFLFFSFSFPVIYVVVKHSTLYDGMRHLLFVLPPLAVLLAIGFSEFMRLAIRPIFKLIILVFVMSSLLLTVVDMARLHPYQTVYFNHLVAGGLPKASQKFERDYWGNSYREGVYWLINHYKNSRKTIYVAGCANHAQYGYYLDRAPYVSYTRQVLEKEIPFLKKYLRTYVSKSFGSVHFHPIYYRHPIKPDVFLCQVRINNEGWIKSRGKILHMVKREGVPLLYVMKVSHRKLD